MLTEFTDSPAETPVEAAKQAAGDDYEKNLPPGRAELVKQWLEDIKKARDHWGPDFKRMRWCMQIAAEGADETWIKSEQYVVPIINRHINQSVAQLYAKSPRAVAKRRRRRMYTLWDGKLESLQLAVQKVTPPQPVQDPTTGMSLPPASDEMGNPLDVGTGQPWQPDPNAVAMLQEISEAEKYNTMADGLAETMEILFGHYASEQASSFKSEMKAVVRRTKVCSVAYVELDFQRVLKRDTAIGEQIDDTTSKIKRIETLQAQQTDPEAPTDPDSPKIEELRTLLNDLKDKEYIIAREGPIFGFPRATRVIPDLKCQHLKTFRGCEWVATEVLMTPDDVQASYKVDIKGKFTEHYDDEGDTKKGSGKGKRNPKVCVYKVQHKANGQTFVVADGYCDFLREPADPDIKIERFWTLFPLVFNEIEHEKKVFPPSDVWLARHTQQEYNRSREGLREHRIAARPKYGAVKGKLDRKERTSLANAMPHEILEFKALKEGQKIGDLFQPIPMVGVDPNLYEVNQYFQDMQRTVGSQEANLGGTSDASATESSIAENSRTASLSDNVDDLDDLLTELAHATGQLMLMELSKETVTEIVGPGAVWPDVPATREQVVKDIYLDIKAGSSGRPNRAADLANMERGMPYILQLPGINPTTIARKYLQLLDLDDDLEEAIIEGQPSIVAMNALAGKPPVIDTGNAETSPNAQGGEGAQNAPGPQQNQNEPGPQPGYPAPAGPLA